MGVLCMQIGSIVKMSALANQELVCWRCLQIGQQTLKILLLPKRRESEREKAVKNVLFWEIPLKQWHS